MGRDDHMLKHSINNIRFFKWSAPAPNTNMYFLSELSDHDYDHEN